jgi:iron complex outermembrane receptor protein
MNFCTRLSVSLPTVQSNFVGRWLTAVAMLGVTPFGLSQTAPVTDMGKVEITSGRNNDTQQRRESTASKIVIGREEIEKQGDANIGEVLKRMPGITLGGNPGRGGGIRMRGLSAGYTQILLDGQRVPPGFSIESLTPEMVERIEIYRAPTAETGAQAIAGTINIITREGRRGMPSELKLASSWQGGYLSPNGSYTTFKEFENWSSNFTFSMYENATPDYSETVLSRQYTSTSTTLARTRINDSSSTRDGFNTTGRLQFKGDPGETLTLMPFMVYSRSHNSGTIALSQTQTVSGTATASTDSANTSGDGNFGLARLNGQWRRKLDADSAMEWKFNTGGWDSSSHTYQTPSGSVLPSLSQSATTRDRSVSLSGKYTNVLGGGHQWVSGAELEVVRRTQTAQPVYSAGDGNMQARTLKYAIYTQDEKQFTPNWSGHGGLRYEQMSTYGNNGETDATNRIGVFSPLLHALWKPNPEGRDQVRMSLTRSFKAPWMQSLLARYTPSRDEVGGSSNIATNPGNKGNPALRPEVALGLDVAVERYLPDGGVMSAAVFHRRVSNLIRNVTSLETISGYSSQLYVSIPQNVGNAITQGIELEAKFRLNQMVTDAPAVDIRSNISFYESNVLSITGPNNRLDQQPSMTANLGGDYRLRSMPFTVGGNINMNPGYTTHSSEYQWLYVSQKRVMDVYGLWRVDPKTSWRLSLSNLSPLSYNTNSLYNSSSLYEDSTTRNRNWTNIQIQLEKKL